MGDSNVHNIVKAEGVQGASFVNGKMDVRSGAEAASTFTIEYTEGNTRNIVEAGGFQGVTFVNRTLNNVVFNIHSSKNTVEKKNEETKEEAKEEKKDEKKDEEKPETNEKAAEVSTKASPGMSLHYLGHNKFDNDLI